ncbi:MAG TPA: glycosyltransferase family A protein [Cryomorphaceae bacterium]|nr:glycosyltransferase family A protein [Cryomorphaceae bacterium]
MKNPALIFSPGTSNSRVAIITPNFNKGDCVVECINSVREQTHENWELLFVDDHSTDQSKLKAEKLAGIDSRISVYTNPKGTKGANAARNLGLSKTEAEYVVYLDSDDLMTPECLENRLADFAEHPECALLIYPTGLFNNVLGDSDVICNIPSEKSDLERFLGRDIVWLISGPIWRRETLLDLDGFDLNLHSQQDFDLHVRALIKGYNYKYFHKQPDVFYRRNIESIPRRQSQSLEHFRDRFKMQLKHHRLLMDFDKLNKNTERLISRSILDLAQMMRWHMTEMGNMALKEAEEMWATCRELKLVEQKEYRIGLKYIRFKHQMIYNRLPALKRTLEKRYHKKLDGLIHHPSQTYCKVTMADYEV